MNNHDEHYYKILSEIETGASVTQRSLSRKLGVALGLTNLLVKRLATKGFIKTRSAIRGKRLKYLLTPKGILEKTRLSVAYLESTIRLYTDTREKVRQRLEEVVPSPKGGREGRRRIIFYGAGEIAEIAYVTLDDLRFELVGVVDDYKIGRKFFDHYIGSPEQILTSNGTQFDRVVIMTLKKTKAIQKKLFELRVSDDKISYLQEPRD